MGAVSTRLCNPFATKERVTVLMSGLDGVGKTSIQCRLRWGMFPEEIQGNVSFYLEEIPLNSCTMLLYDLGSSPVFREQLIAKITDAKTLIYVVDCSPNEEARIGEEARAELHNHLKLPNMKGVNLLVLVSKRDRPSEISNEMIVEQLGLDIVEDRKWHILSTSAKTGEGLEEVMKWIEENITGVKE